MGVKDWWLGQAGCLPFLRASAAFGSLPCNSVWAEETAGFLNVSFRTDIWSPWLTARHCPAGSGIRRLTTDAQRRAKMTGCSSERNIRYVTRTCNATPAAPRHRRRRSSPVSQHKPTRGKGGNQESQGNDLRMFLKTSNTSKRRTNRQKRLAGMQETAFSLGEKSIYSTWILTVPGEKFCFLPTLIFAESSSGFRRGEIYSLLNRIFFSLSSRELLWLPFRDF